MNRLTKNLLIFFLFGIFISTVGYLGTELGVRPEFLGYGILFVCVVMIFYMSLPENKVSIFL
jgi:hypothetical protein